MNSQSGRALMSGNEAIARGAIEAGIGFCASYPGTPSTEITTVLMRFSRETGMYVEWSTNEKVALEAAAAASWAGIPAICPMKSLGLNVAADFLLNLNLSGTGQGGLVIVVCDDPRGHSSSNEQDSRFFAKAAKIPLLEPHTCQQAKDIIPFALSLSQKEQIPVIVRSTTRLSHTRSVVEMGSAPKREWRPIETLPDGLYNVPDPHHRNRDLQATLRRVASEFDRSEWNQWIHEGADDGLTVISTGVGSLYAEEALEVAGLHSVGHLSIVTTFPIPTQTITRAIGRNRVLFVEEGPDPFFEDETRVLSTVMGKNVEIHGRRDGLIPSFGELTTDIVLESLYKIGSARRDIDEEYESLRQRCDNVLIPRPLTFCAGCTHRNVYWALQRVKRRLKGGLVVTGDIGCYSLGVFYNRSMDTMQAMGSGIGTASGLGQLHRFGYGARVATITGDSTFFHACLPGLINARHKNADLLFIIVDNNTTAMTGFQKHPGSYSAESDDTRISIEAIVKSVQPDAIEIVDGEDIPALIDTFHRMITKSGLKVAIVRSICRLADGYSVKSSRQLPRVYIDEGLCVGEKCNICVGQYSCVALAWDKTRNTASIIDDQCIRCGSCIDVCPYGAIKREE